MTFSGINKYEKAWQNHKNRNISNNTNFDKNINC